MEIKLTSYLRSEQTEITLEADAQSARDLGEIGCDYRPNISTPLIASRSTDVGEVMVGESKMKQSA